MAYFFFFLPWSALQADLKWLFWKMYSALTSAGLLPLSRLFSAASPWLRPVSFLPELGCCALMPWAQCNQMVLEELCLLWSFFNSYAPAFARRTNCFSRVRRLKPMDCFCSLVAVVILSLLWNSHLQGDRTSCSHLAFCHGPHPVWGVPKGWIVDRVD